jgi:tripeptidyl-peptidase I
MLHLNFSAILLLAMCQLSQALGSSKLQHVADPERAFNGLYTGVDGSRGSLHTFREDSLGLTLSHGIMKGYRVPPTQYHDVVFVIKQRNLDTLTRILHEVSDPASEEYGNHLSKEEIDDLTSNGDSNEVVLAYLKSVGAKMVIVECSGELITARAPISLWERILDTEFHMFSHKSENHASDTTDETDTLDGKTFIRSEKYSIPISLDDHIAFVLNTIQIPQLQSRRYQPTEVPSHEAAKSSAFSVSSLYTEGSVSPQLLNDGYNIDDNTGHPRATQAALQGFGQVFSPEDLTTFQSYYGIPIQAVNKSQANMTVTPEWCVLNNLSICAESNLDIMYMMAVANTPTIHAYFRASSMASWFLNLAHSKNPPLVLSLSYGADENRITKGEALIMANAAIRLGVRGVTIIVASGDDGVSSPYARSNPTQCGYVPSWPASCPYITSVGATQVSSTLIILT